MMERWRPLRPWRPSRAIDEVEHYMDEVLAGWPLRTFRRVPAEEMLWSPPVDVYEKPDKFVVRVEAPGVKKEAIDVSMTGETLTIKGHRKVSKDAKDEEYLRSEISYGSFSRSLTLPTAVDAEKIEATYEDGILEVTVPKAKEAKPAKIQIKTKGA